MKGKSTGSTRREFLGTAAAAVAAPYIVSSNALGLEDQPAAKKQVDGRYQNEDCVGNGGPKYEAAEGNVPGLTWEPPTKLLDRAYKGPANNLPGDFLHCVKTREKPFRDVTYAHRVASVCHLGNIAYELKRPLRWDPVKEEFPGDDEANRTTWRPMRGPWRL